MDFDKFAFKLVVFCLLFLGWNWTAMFLLGFNLTLLIFGQRIFAKFLADMRDKYNLVSDPMKKKLFADLNSMKPGDGRSKLKILEIGGGSGANFQYWTGPADVDVIDPNPFHSSYFEENRAKAGTAKLQINPIKQGFGEDLKSVGIEDNSYDVVVMTLVLCSVNDIPQCIKEIQRVLRPGGKFYYLEHIAADQGDTLRNIQQALMFGGFWPALFDGCCVNRDTPKVVEEVGGWTRLEQNKFDFPKPPAGLDKMFTVIREVIRPHVMGVAEK